MPSVRPTVTEARTRLAVLVRQQVENAAGDDGRLSATDRDHLAPFVRAASGSATTVNQAVDAAMSAAMAAWSAQNQTSGPGKAWLSQAELGRIAQGDVSLGLLTRAAVQIAANVKGTRPPLSVALDAPAGVGMGVSGVRVLTVSLSADVPVGTTFGVLVDGHRVDVTRMGGGLNVHSLVPPPGYGIEVVSTSMVRDPVPTAVLKITRDPETALTDEYLKDCAKNGLVAYVKNERLDDADWGDYFPTTWAQAEAPVRAGIDALFANPETEVIRKRDTITYVGRGPYDLYTEITVDKRTGKVSNAYVEID